MPMAPLRHRSSATPLALAWAALVLYASLYPFANWRWPPGQAFVSLAVLPWTRWYGPFDMWANAAGYLPLGALLMIAARRSGGRALPALLLAVGAPALLSYATEVAQQFLPGRVPAMEDFLMNSAGAAAGALLAWAGHGLGFSGRWHRLRQRWFARESAGALALLALWPVALLFPAPVVLGLGQVGERLRETVAGWLQGVSWASWAYEMLATSATRNEPLRPLAESLIVALGLLAPVLVAYAVVAPGWRRVVLALGATAAGVGAVTLSTLLNFGPSHALGWVAPPALVGLVLGALLAVALAPLPQRVATGLGLVAVTGLVVGVAQAPADPYFAQSLHAWEQGRFVRFHGLAQWLGWLWPYAALLWLLARLGQRP